MMVTEIGKNEDSGHSSIRAIRAIRDKNMPEFAVKIPSGSRMARLNESHECRGVDSCHSSKRVVRDENMPKCTPIQGGI
jgi:hypothetical protein